MEYYTALIFIFINLKNEHNKQFNCKNQQISTEVQRNANKRWQKCEKLSLTKMFVSLPKCLVTYLPSWRNTEAL